MIADCSRQVHRVEEQAKNRMDFLCFVIVVLVTLAGELCALLSSSIGHSLQCVLAAHLLRALL